MQEVQVKEPISTPLSNNGSSGEKPAHSKVKRVRKTVGIPTVGSLINDDSCNVCRKD